MTSQGPYRDDLVRRMMIADDQPLRKPTKPEADFENESMGVVGEWADRHSQLLLRRQAHPNRESPELTRDIDNDNTEHRLQKINPDLQVNTDVVAVATTTPKASPNAKHAYQITPTTPEHLSDQVPHHSTSLDLRVGSRSSPRRVSYSSSSDADDEEEIPVSFEPEAAKLLPQHLQENLRKIVSESQQKIVEKAQRSARVASGNTFNSAYFANDNTQSTQGDNAQAEFNQGREGNYDHHLTQINSRQSVNTFHNYAEKGKADLSYANITNPDIDPPSSSDDDMKRLLLGRQDRHKGEYNTSAPLQTETGSATMVQNHADSDSSSSVDIDHSSAFTHGQADSNSSRSAQVIQGSMGVAHPSVQTYPNMMQNERIGHERMAATGSGTYAELGLMAEIQRQLDEPALGPGSTGEAVGIPEMRDPRGLSMGERIDKLEIELHEFIGMPGAMASTAGMSIAERMERLEVGLANSQEPVSPNADRKEMMVRIQGQEARMKRLRGEAVGYEAALRSHTTAEDEKEFARHLRAQFVREAAERKETAEKYEADSEQRGQGQVDDAVEISKENNTEYGLQVVRKQAKKGLSSFLGSPYSPPTSAVRRENASVSDRSISTVFAKVAKIEGPKKWVQNVLGGMNKPVGGQRSRSPFHALSQEDLYPSTPKRGLMYSTMATGHSLAQTVRSTIGDQRWHHSYKDLHSGDRDGVSCGRDDSDDSIFPPTIETPTRGSYKTRTPRLLDFNDDVDTPVVGSGIRRDSGSQELPEDTRESGLGNLMGRALRFDDSTEELDARGMSRGGLTPTRQFRMPGRPYNRSPGGVTATARNMTQYTPSGRPYARTLFYPVEDVTATDRALTAHTTLQHEFTGEELHPDSIGMSLTTDFGLPRYNDFTETSSGAHNTDEDDDVAATRGAMTARGLLEDY